MLKKVIAAILAAMILCGSFGEIAYAGESKTSVGAEATDNKELEKNMKEVLATVKTKLGLGKDLTGFSYYVYNEDDTLVYTFMWSMQDGQDEVFVRCDDKGRIYEYSAGFVDNAKPQFLKREVEATAMDYIRQIAPELADHVKLERTDAFTWNSCYAYYYNRYENDIRVDGNYITVYVGFSDKKLRSYDCEWTYDVKIPSAKGIISKEEATAKISKEIDMELRYHIAYDKNGKEKAFLAYTPSKSYIAVDAKSGKIYTESSYWGEDNYDEEPAEEESKEADAGGGYEMISDEEMEKIVGVNDLISRDEAIEKLRSNKSIYMDDEYTSITGTLERDGDRYLWYVRGSDERPIEYDDEDEFDEDDYRGYFFATIDAKTGTIEYYNSSVKEYYKNGRKKNFTKKQCRQIFETFAKKQDKKSFSKTKLVDSMASLVDYTKNGRQVTYGYEFNYGRFYKDIPVSYDRIWGEVDAVTGKVYTYVKSFSDVKLPSPANVIGEKKAKQAYLSYDGFDLGYEIYVVNKKVQTEGKKKAKYVSTTKMRLTYATDINPGFVDANTGKQINYQGEEYVAPVVEGDYTDIAGDPGERAIFILSALGVRLPGSKFEPTKAITRQEFCDMLRRLPDSGEHFRFNDTHYISWEGEVEGGNLKLTRQQAAFYVAQYLGYGEIAEYDIFRNDCKDADKIPAKYKGGVAMVTALGYMEPDADGFFNPQAEMTRSEAAQLLVKFL